VLNAGSGARQRPIEREARPESIWPDATMPRAATEPLPEVKYHSAAPRRGRHLAAIVASVAALAVVAGVALFLSRPSSKRLASACGTAGCHRETARSSRAPKPAAAPPASARKAIRHSQPAATHSAARHSLTPSATPTPTRTTTSSPTASPTVQPVQVSYAVVRQHPHSFQAQFTIVNKGSKAIDGWELIVVLPDDRIRSVWDASFHTDGDTLYIDPPKFQRTIAPGATLTENLAAHGSTTTPASCTFNGSAC
jgi:hypothetical protein